MRKTTAPAARTRAIMGIRALCEGAIMVALSLILGLFKVFELPQGGSISLEMLPLFLYCVRWGMKSGFVACLAFGVLQIFVQGVLAYGWQSILLDYIAAFTVIGVAGLFRGRERGIFWGTLLGAAARFAVHFISGITIYRILAPTELFNTTFTSPWMYSLAYNGSYVAIDTAICLIIFAALYLPLRRYITGADLRK